MKNLNKFALGLLAAGFVHTASAATLVAYNFTGTDTATRLAPTSVSSGLTAVPFAFGAGFSGGSGVSTNGIPQHSVYAFSSLTTEAVSATSTDYFSFTVTADSGFELNLNSLSFSYTFNNSNNNPVTTESATFYVRSSADNFGANIASFIKPAVAGQNNGWVSTGSISLTASQYQNLGGVEFRIYVEDNLSTTSFSARLDNVVLDGAVAAAIPEPSSLALLAGGAVLGATSLRRRRRRDARA